MTIRAYRDGFLMETSPEWDIADATEPMEGEFGSIYPPAAIPPASAIFRSFISI